MLEFSQTVIETPIGKISMRFNQERLVELLCAPEDAKATPRANAAATRVAQELAHYFINPTHQFTLDLHIQGTPFQQKVWQALRNIPSGTTLTYGMLAKMLKTSPRAIGRACRTNAIILIIPCHRIVGTTHLGGYAGARQGRFMEIKEWLLTHEKNAKKS